MCRQWTIIALVVLSALNMGYTEINPESIVGIWLLDEGQGKSIKDNSGNRNDGKIVGAKWTNGKLGKGLYFDGKSHVEIPASKTTNNYQNGFTYLLWIKPTEPPPNVNTRVIERDWHNPTIQIGPTDFYASIAVNADQAATHIRGGTWKQDKWSFVATTYDGDKLKLYVDGKIIGDKTVGKADVKSHPATPAEHQGSIWLASWKAPNWDFRGALDDIGIFNIPLETDAINNIMRDGLEKASAISIRRKMTVMWGELKNARLSD